MRYGGVSRRSSLIFLRSLQGDESVVKEDRQVYGGFRIISLKKFGFARGVCALALHVQLPVRPVPR